MRGPIKSTLNSPSPIVTHRPRLQTGGWTSAHRSKQSFQACHCSRQLLQSVPFSCRHPRPPCPFVSYNGFPSRLKHVSPALVFGRASTCKTNTPPFRHIRLRQTEDHSVSPFVSASAFPDASITPCSVPAESTRIPSTVAGLRVSWVSLAVVGCGWKHSKS